MSPRDRAACVLVIATLAFAALALGSVPRWAACITAMLGLLSAAPYIASRREITSPGPLLVLLVAALGITLIQWAPLPFFLVRLLSPAKAELLAANATALAESSPAFASLSYDPPATLVEIARLVGYLAVAYAALRIAQTSRGRMVLAAGAVGVGLLVVGVVAAHIAVGAGALYGVYEPEYARPRFWAPLLNPNHLAGFFGLLTPLAVGLAMHQAGARRLIWTGAAILLAGGALATRSRAGVTALAIGAVVTGLILWAQRRRGNAERGRRVTIASVAVIVACVVVLLAVLVGKDAWDEISRTRADELTGRAGKVAAWRASLPLVSENWLTGLGRGGFETSFTSAEGEPGEVYSHVENEYLQAVLDWGVPLAALLAVLALLVARRAAGRWSAGPIEAGCLGGLVAIALHDTLDFSLAFAGVATPAVVMLAVLVRAEVGRAASRPRLRFIRLGAVVAGATVIALAATPLARPARGDADALAVAARARKVQLDDALGAWRRHPSDHLAAGYTAQALHDVRDPRSAAVTARAITFHPRHPDLHRLAARILIASQRPAQAQVEYALAVRHAWRGATRKRLLAEIVRRFPDPAVAVRALPVDPKILPILVIELGGMGQHPLALALARRVANLYPQMSAPWREVARLARHQGNRALTLVAAERAARTQPDAASALAHATALVESDRAPDAILVLDRALAEGYPTSVTITDVELLRELARAQALVGRATEARDTLVKALGLAGTNRVRLAQVHTQLADLEQKAGNSHRAGWHREQAAAMTAQ